MATVTTTTTRNNMSLSTSTEAAIVTGKRAAETDLTTPPGKRKPAFFDPGETFPRLGFTPRFLPKHGGKDGQKEFQEVWLPFLYFEDWDQLYHELKYKTKVYTDSFLTDLCLDFFDMIDHETAPLILLVGFNEMLAGLPDHKLFQFGYGAAKAKNQVKEFPELKHALQVVRRIWDESKELCGESSALMKTAPTTMAFYAERSSEEAPAAPQQQQQQPSQQQPREDERKKAAQEDRALQIQLQQHHQQAYVGPARQVSPGEEGKTHDVSVDLNACMVRYCGRALASPNGKPSLREESRQSNAPEAEAEAAKKPQAKEMTPEAAMKHPAKESASEGTERPSDTTASAAKAQTELPGDLSENASSMEEKATELSTEKQADSKSSSAATADELKEKSANENATNSGTDMTEIQEATGAASAETASEDVATETMEEAVESDATQTTEESGNKQVQTAKKSRRGSGTKAANTPQRQHTPIMHALEKEDCNIPRFQDVKATLEELHFVFYKDGKERFYCRPGKDPRSAVNRKEGKDYFTSEQAFRSHLCAYGLGADLDFDYSCEGYHDVEKWIRFAIVQRAVLGETKLPATYTGANTVWTLLPLLGMDTNKGYVVKDGPKYDKEKEFTLHLSRFGLPKSCDFTNVTEDERLQVELHLAFAKRDLLNPDPTSGPRSARKRSRQAPTPPNKGRKQAKKAKRKISSRAAGATATVEGSPGSFDAKALADCHQKPPGRTNAKTFGARNISKEIEEPTDSEKLKKSLEKLENPEYTLGGDDCSEVAYGESGSQFRKNISEINQVLEQMVQSRITDSLSSTDNNMKSAPAVMYVSGVPGTGKTTGISYCCNLLIKKCKDNRDFEEVEPVVVEVNAAHLASCSTDAAKNHIIDAIWSKCGFGASQKTEKALLKSLSTTRSNHKKRFVILVLDEIDKLVRENSSSAKAGNAAERVLKDLGAWASRPTNRFALICIGNSINNARRRRIQQCVEINHEYTFPAYSKDDIVDIIQYHIGTQIIHPTALQFIANKVANTSGDARQAIELAKTAIKEAQEKLQSQPIPENNAEEEPAKQKDYIVKMKDVVKSKDFIRCSERIANLPAQGKIIVSVAVKMLKEAHSAGSTVALKRWELKKKAIVALHKKNPNDYVDGDDVNGLIETLDDCGIVTFAQHPSCDCMQDTFTSNFQAHELETALEEGLGENDFLRSFA